MSTSDESAGDLIASFKKGAEPRKPSFSPGAFVSEQSEGNGEGEQDSIEVRRQPVRRQAVAVRVPPVHNRHEYTYYEPPEKVERILQENTRRGGNITYEVKLASGAIRHLSFEQLLSLEGGSAALNNLQQYDDSSSESADNSDMQLRGRSTAANMKQDFVDITALDISSEDDLASTQVLRRSSRKRYPPVRPIDIIGHPSEDQKRRGRRRKKEPQQPKRRLARERHPVQQYDSHEDDDDGNDDDDGDDDDDDDDDDSSEMDILRSDILPNRKRKRGRPSRLEQTPRTGVRQSDRSTRAQNNMQEAKVNDIYRSDSEPRQAATTKVTVIREIFETLPRDNLFRSRHVEGCEVCYEGPKVAPLIYCQGCSLAYHKNCIGNRTNREHLVTKVGDKKFVLQCKRCINGYQKKDRTAPNLARCQDCDRKGDSSKPFRHRKTAVQEQKEREENDGQDPIVDIPEQLINNAHNVLFRCTKCSRAWHYHHLPPLSPYAMDINRDEVETADERFQEYSRQWLCKDCEETQDKKVSTLIAWRPSDVETYRPHTSCADLNEDEKQYLIKWEGQSYFRASWFSGAWTWGVTAPVMRKAFFKREDGPKMRTEDAIPEEYLRIDIVLDVKYTSYVEVRSEEIDKARIKEVDKALIKYKGLGYEDAVWEEVPTPEDGDRWLDFVTAYNDWVSGRYVRYPKQGPLKARLEKARNTPFAKLEKEKQPDNLVGGELMKYQIEGLNWIYYQWYSQNNGILADEMGLGKTIQVIGFMATLLQEHNCFPFLVVVPNSTCANWRREIKQWIPSLRVVTFFGSSAARDMAYKYEMYPEGTKELRAHVVVTSYDAASDPSCRKILRGVSWAGLIVDEGQRLKNDKSQLYTALNAVKAPFRLLMTGTPLQNNARELFNLMQFLDDTIVASELEEKYADMTSENIKELHEQIRPFILRRTKAQVLTFLPPLGQIILPISMSHLQKTLYKSILAKNPQLLKAMFTSDKALKNQERANLSNILMQLRKCLCHPFVYSREIEERTDIAAVSHRNLVEASAKLNLLELLLPKLQERGHRVLIFSQFLDMLNIIEDFLDGMQMAYQRLDGTMGSLEKQKRIDQFNAPDSPLFAFLLSTRAGGVGINLATADTVIILDPDFNPHQDIQAISRAHRIGQKNKVLCFQLMTRASVEEKMVQMGRKKMALDHVVVERLDAEDVEDQDLESILKHGAAELFTDDNQDHDIRFDDASIEKLLDRSQIENTRTSGDNSAESQFSFARVWANDSGALEETMGTMDDEEEQAPDPGVWDKILKERQAAAAAEALARADALGRGKRARGNVDYATTEKDAAADAPDGTDGATPSPVKPEKKRRRKNASSDDDTDFWAESDEEEEEESDAGSQGDAHDTDLEREKSFQQQQRPTTKGTLVDKSLQKPPHLANVNSKTVKPPNPPKSHGGSIPTTSNTSAATKPFQRAQLPTRNPLEPTAYPPNRTYTCPACHRVHPRGACELKAAGVEHCGLCGLAHYGVSRTCPHIKSETQVREMLQALKNSPEKKGLVDVAVKYLRGVKGHLVQNKKKAKEKGVGAGASSGPFGGTPGAEMVRGAQSVGAAASQYQPGGYGGYNNNSAAGGGAPSGHVAPGSVGSYLQGQQQHRHHLPQHQQHQQQHYGQYQHPNQHQNPDNLQDREVETALRGFLGR